jgi:hypothetical protein
LGSQSRGIQGPAGKHGEGGMTKPDILRVIQNEGIEVKKKGKYWWCLCPFHEDTNASMSIDTNKQRFICYGCGEKGDVIDFIQRLRKVSFKEALEILKMEKVVRDTTPRRVSLKNLNEWRDDRHKTLSNLYRKIHRSMRKCKSMEEVCKLATAIHELPLIEDEMDILSNGKKKDICNLYKYRYMEGE